MTWWLRSPVSTIPSCLRLAQILQDHTVRSRSPDAGYLTAFHKSGDGLLQCLQLVQLGAHGLQMLARQISRFQAGALSVPDQRRELSHLLDREAEVAAAADEGEAPDVLLAIAPLTAVATAGRRQEADLLIVSDRRRVRPGASGQLSDLQVWHCICPLAAPEPQVT
jgi:hypothetical protein